MSETNGIQVINGARIEIAQSYELMSRRAADYFLEEKARIPDMGALVPTGTTPELFWELLSQEPADKLSGLWLYNLDEYCEPDEGEPSGYRLLDPADPRSYQFYMKERILRAHPAIRSRFPDVRNVKAPGTYDRIIDEEGGIHLAVNGLGSDGHVFGFNEPGIGFDSQTHLVRLSENTQTVNKDLTGMTVPEYALTTGIATGMKTRKAITLVSGLRKADILRRLIWDEVSPALPATVLRTHPDHLFLVDEAAASKL